MDLHTAFGFLVLCGLGLNSYADDCAKAFEGGSYTIELNSPQQDRDTLYWVRDANRNHVYIRRRGSVGLYQANRGYDVNSKGDLVLNNLTRSMSGEYKAEHHNKDGKLIKSTTKKLCVVPKAPVPKLVVTCSSSGAVLQCDHDNISGFSVSWFQNNTEMKEKMNPLKLSNSEEHGPYSCRLTNQELDEDTEDSTAVMASCSDECTNALEGRSYTIELASPEEEGGDLVWKNNEDEVLYHRQNGSVIVGDDEDVDETGSLYLANVNPSMSGMYTAEQHVNDGRLIKIMMRKLCVVTNASFPKLSVTCSSSGVHCLTGEMRGVSLSWLHNNMEMIEKVNPLQLNKPVDQDEYTCRLTNDDFPDHKKDTTVIISCSGSVEPQVVRAVYVSTILLMLILALALASSLRRQQVLTTEK